MSTLCENCCTQRLYHHFRICSINGRLIRLIKATCTIINLDIPCKKIDHCQKYAKQVTTIVHCHRTEKKCCVDCNQIPIRSYRLFMIPIMMKIIILIMVYIMSSSVATRGVQISIPRNPFVLRRSLYAHR